MLALPHEPAPALPTWTAGALWESTADAWPAGPAALCAELEAHRLP